jgi:predicted metalloprotease
MRLACHHSRKLVVSGGLAQAHALTPEPRFGGGVGGRRPGLEMQMLRSLIVVVALSSMIISSVSAGAAPSSTQMSTRQSRGAAQADDWLAAAADAARELSMLEADRDFDALYERMHPDALAVVPRSAVVGWYERYFEERETSELEVTGVEPEPWTWPVTGVTYDDAVTVKFVQPYSIDGVTTDVSGEVHLVPFDDGWGWFFGASRAFVDEQVALYGDDGSATMFSLSQESAETTPIPREVRFPDPLHAHIDRFWEARFQEAGRVYDSPQGVVAFDEPIVTACGRADPEREAAFYCVIDETIYYSAEFRTLIENQIGDFAWVIVVAHEWGHHIQAKLGFDLGVVPDRAGDAAPIELEQQADCLAGAYAVDAELSGWLDAGDIDEALTITEISGDPPGTAWNDPRAHGTGDVRIDAFMTGYNTGIAGCDLDLSAASPAA